MAAAFAQVGEFSFILGTVARELGLVSDTGWDALVAASILSIALNPTVYRWARRRATPGADLSAAAAAAPAEIDPRRAILIGYGPVGRIVHRLLADRGADVTVVDVNLETVRGLRARGIKAVNGDVLRAGTLDEAGIATAASLVLSADVEEAAEIVRQARLLNPDAARARALRPPARRGRAAPRRGQRGRGGRGGGRRRARGGGDRRRRPRSGGGGRAAHRAAHAAVRVAAGVIELGALPSRGCYSRRGAMPSRLIRS